MTRMGVAATAFVLACCAAPNADVMARAPAVGQAHANAAATTTTVAPAGTGAPAIPLQRVAAAIEAAERGDATAATQAEALAGHPLQGWVEYAGLRRDVDTLPPAFGQAFLARHKGEAVAAAFREAWLASLSRREDWATFRAAWSPAIEDTTLRCAELRARLQTGAADAAWIADAQAIWRSTGKSLPDACDPVFDALAAKGAMTDALRWERFDKAAAEGNAAVMRVAARGLAGEDAARAAAYADFIAHPGDAALKFAPDARSRAIAALGLAQLAKDDPDAAEALLPRVTTALALDPTQRGSVLYQVALWSAASYLPASARRLAAVPDAAYDARLHEWQVREALARSDWPAALAALRRMPPEQRSDPRWTYFEGRLLGLAGDTAGARAAYARAAREPVFHGFLAADRIDAPYALCPWVLDTTDAARAAVAADPALVRALQLHAIDRTPWALLEWKDALSRFDDSQRRIAVGLAEDNGWFDRAVFGLGRTPEELRLYDLRFPLHHDATIRREAAKNDLDPAWVAAEIRAESVFDPKARSAANARGLMQVVPATGMEEARRQGIPWHGVETLYEPEANIAIGTVYLRKLLDRYGGKPYFAIAGYNAGPTPLQRWQSQRPGMDPDFWIETISYGETRDYVARVLAFSTIYDWRLDGDALPLTARMAGDNKAKRKPFACPAAPAP
jgi:soluble lytic murein transglycosylase